ncbi:hypothetical protein C8A03DRAFT_17288 [Achaetomium macrosporum]|uniref:F-box domain-containing protein n=1 Tax=Achaetomium macrosporum TaxID=79813 RepID=A0AAN7HCJ1_9PEZI|nr:hypothetical protein C8A03DRAFT_17288 [Achaetomium macrosporum]
MGFQPSTYPSASVNDHLLDDNLPAPPSEVESQPHGPSLAPTADLGALAALPVELVHQILAYLDMRSLADFRTVNRQAAATADTLIEYGAIAAHAPTVLRSIPASETGRLMTSAALYATLRSPDCEKCGCGHFGGYVYLVTCTRLCYACFSRNIQWLPMTTDFACLSFGLDRRAVDALPERMRIVPRRYSPRAEPITSRDILVDRGAVIRAATAFHGSRSAMEAFVRVQGNQQALAYREQGRLSGMMPGHRQQQYLTGCPVNGAASSPLRYAAVVRVPWLKGPGEEGVEWGFHCAACLAACPSPCTPLDLARSRRLLTVELIDEHLREFGPIRNGRHHPDESQSPGDLADTVGESICRRGGWQLLGVWGFPAECVDSTCEI